MSIRVTTTQGRMVYVNIAEKDKPKDKKIDPKYRLTFITDGPDDELIEMLENAYEQAVNLGRATWGNYKYNGTFPYLDGDGTNENGRPFQDFFHGNYFFTARSSFQPSVCDKDLKEIDPKELYNGANCKISITLKPYISGKNQGVSIYLDYIQLLDGGEEITFGRSFEDIFGGNN